MCESGRHACEKIQIGSPTAYMNCWYKKTFESRADIFNIFYCA